MPHSPEGHDEHCIEQSCLLCNQPDTSQMVSCDECQRWYHFACAGVTDAIADYDWSCQRCHNARISAPVTSASAVPPIASSSGVTNTPGETNVFLPDPISGPPSSQAPLQPLPASSAHDAMRTYMSFVSIPVDPLMTTAPSTISTNAASAPFGQGSYFTHASTSLIRQNLVSRLPTELRLRFLEEEQALEMKHLLQRYQLLMDQTPASNINSIPSVSQRGPTNSAAQCHLFSAHQPRMTAAGLPPAPTLPNPQYHSSPVLNPQFRPRCGLPSHSSPVPNLVPNRPSMEFPQTNPLQATGISNETVMLNRSQIAARQAVSKELPEYNGDPEHWPLFYGTFESTTRICGYCGSFQNFPFCGFR
ncbi:uncharacterized protein LOC134222416 [Armigeres subalbatus]|uniref:uncharacterized protein LOC134222416 n=1 Tax=Armigeres subalbatus TaxID=124917 RepID=UPI002ED614A5